MKTGVVDVGGGLRGIYAVGVLDYCMEHGIRFDLGIGVSAGSANLASYAAGQIGRNYKFYTEYAFRRQYMSIGNFIFKKSYVDMDYVYGTLSRADGEYPLDYPSLRANPMEFYVVATDARTGQAKYFDKGNIQQDDYDIFKASSAIPFVCKPYEIQGVSYYDGALGDPVPVEKAFQLGCDRVVVILTKPEHELRNPKKDKRFAARIRNKYPAAADKLCQRAMRYNKSVALAQEYAKQGKALIISPDNTCGVDTLKKDKVSLQRLYKKGYKDGQKILNYLCDGK
ncbi:MAG: patatin family protein [Candidatus Limivivens sp.]|nr:patatin family protein [Candidatus Limivivens sp.]